MDINLDCIGAVTRNVGTSRFGQALFGLFNDAFDIKFCSVCAFPPACEPHAIVSEGATPADSEVARKFAAEYVNGRYRDDPKVASRNGGRAPAVYRASPDGTLDMLHRPWLEPRICSQLVQLSALDGVLYRLSLYRDERAGAFLAKDVAAMRSLGRFAVPAVHRHIGLRGGSSGMPHDARDYVPAVSAKLNTPEMREHLAQVFLETPHRLSRREAEVCAGIVLGYSTVAIGLNLQIACNTVATHRKRAYKKLGVSCQSELFGRYFENVRGLQNAA
jgi:DNA-binding CsgD family transcriptional regulator